MAVSPPHQGKGISKLLMDQCLARAKQVGAKKLTLYSNSQLLAAISLYLKYGFKQVPLENSPFVTADVKMELLL
jgi:ribosomal protein S18 acetylase RimI-like enzyme